MKTLQYDPETATRHLAASDLTLGRLIERVGPMRMRRSPYKTPFDALLRSIVYQQLSGKAAGTIHRRVLDLFPRRRPGPERLLALSDARLRGAGLSGNKARAVRDLAAKTLDGTVPSARRIVAMDDEDIVERLVKVRGIGRWTVEMLLIFDLGRPDVLPVDDLGVRKGYALTYRRRELPAPSTMLRRGRLWRPYRSVASWYLWRATETITPGDR